ncbi:MAG: hypothetical protein K2W94_04920 [Alphaproteobacteria bacterium]|nr:hypothetical protein [Alphaproteobacteria bacterium]
MQFQYSRQMSQQRAARTKSMIQLAGLLVKSGIIKKLGIEIGADLQKDEHQKKKAYTLLGMFITQLSVPTEIEKMKETENLGKQFLSQKQNDEMEQISKL